MDQAEREGLFDDAGFPIGTIGTRSIFPASRTSHAYALEVRGDAMSPTYRDGDLLVVSPVANVRRHDRVVLRTAEGALLAGMLMRRTAQRIELAPFAEATGVQTLPDPRGGVAGTHPVGQPIASDRRRLVTSVVPSPSWSAMRKEKAAGEAGGQSNREASQRQGGHRLVAGRRRCNALVWTNARTCPPSITPNLNAS